jgi:hypothetical protein
LKVPQLEHAEAGADRTFAGELGAEDIEERIHELADATVEPAGRL